MSRSRNRAPRPGRFPRSGAGASAALAAFAALATFVSLLGAACSPAAPSTPAATFQPPAAVRSHAPWPPGDGARPVHVDTDLGADDLVALAVLFGDPDVEVRAVTVSGTGLVHCDPGVDTARGLLAAFGLADVPVACGRQEAGPGARPFPADWRTGADARWGLELPQGGPPADPEADAVDLLVRAAADAGGALVTVQLGPWTNLADALAQNPGLAADIAGVHAMIGALDVPGNVEVDGASRADGTEWNAVADPAALAAVLATDVPVTIVPLDATNAVPVPADFAARVEPGRPATGATLVHDLYSRNPSLTEPGLYQWDGLAVLLLTSPDLATWQDVDVSVATAGREAGRIARSAGGRVARVATAAHGQQAMEAIIAALARTDR